MQGLRSAPGRRAVAERAVPRSPRRGATVTVLAWIGGLSLTVIAIFVLLYFGLLIHAIVLEHRKGIR